MAAVDAEHSGTDEPDEAPPGLISQFLLEGLPYKDLCIALFWLGFGLLDTPTPEEPTINLVPLCKDLDTYVEIATQLGYDPDRCVHLRPALVTRAGRRVAAEAHRNGSFAGHSYESTRPAGSSSSMGHMEATGASTPPSPRGAPGVARERREARPSEGPVSTSVAATSAASSSTSSGEGRTPLAFAPAPRGSSAAATRRHVWSIEDDELEAAAASSRSAGFTGGSSSQPAGGRGRRKASCPPSAWAGGGTGEEAEETRTPAVSMPLFGDGGVLSGGGPGSSRSLPSMGSKHSGRHSGHGSRPSAEGVAREPPHDLLEEDDEQQLPLYSRGSASSQDEEASEMLECKVKLLYAGGWSESSGSEGHRTPPTPSGSSAPASSSLSGTAGGHTTAGSQALVVAQAGGLDADHVQQFTVTFISDTQMHEVLEDISSLCTFCLDDMKFGEELCRLPCMHTFHRRCVHAWLERDRRCMLCRLDITRPRG